MLSTIYQRPAGPEKPFTIHLDVADLLCKGGNSRLAAKAYAAPSTSRRKESGVRNEKKSGGLRRHDDRVKKTRSPRRGVRESWWFRRENPGGPPSRGAKRATRGSNEFIGWYR